LEDLQFIGDLGERDYLLSAAPEHPRELSLNVGVTLIFRSGSELVAPVGLLIHQLRDDLWIAFSHA
jgi:hypothetical protein